MLRTYANDAAVVDGSGFKSAPRQVFSLASVQNKTHKFGQISPGISASADRVLDTFRAAIRCDCTGCGNHKKRCLHIAGHRISRTRHPVVMHRIDGRLICHVCLNRSLEFHQGRLYPDIPLRVR